MTRPSAEVSSFDGIVKITAAPVGLTAARPVLEGQEEAAPVAIHPVERKAQGVTAWRSELHAGKCPAIQPAFRKFEGCVDRPFVASAVSSCVQGEEGNREPQLVVKGKIAQSAEDPPA